MGAVQETGDVSIILSDQVYSEYYGIDGKRNEE